MSASRAADQSFRSDLPEITLPARSLFSVDVGYLNSASRHPLSDAAADAVVRYAADLRRFHGPAMGISIAREVVRRQFARLINADEDEIGFVPSTVFAENLIARAVGLPEAGHGVVTDRFHYSGSHILYQRLLEAGSSVVVVRPKAGRIDPRNIASAITPETRLIAISKVSAATGFEHDLAAVCAVAHERGVRVYADMIQAAGITPIDVKASGIDFCACATYKWLMGEMGLGFVYVRREHLETFPFLVAGQDQVDGDLPIMDREDGRVEQVIMRGGAAGIFEVGTLSATAVKALEISLPLINDIGVATLEAARRPLLGRARELMQRKRFEPLTPTGSRSAILSFVAPSDPEPWKRRLEAAGVTVTWDRNLLRMAFAMFNSDDDLDLLERALDD